MSALKTQASGPPALISPTRSPALPSLQFQVPWPFIYQTQDSQTFLLQLGVQANNPLFFQQVSGSRGPSFKHRTLDVQAPLGEEPRVLSPGEWAGGKARMG